MPTPSSHKTKCHKTKPKNQFCEEGLCRYLAFLWRLGQGSDGGEHFEFAPLDWLTGPPGKCAALVGPIASFIAAPVCCGAFWTIVAAEAWESRPAQCPVTIAKLESAMAAAIAKIKDFIWCSERREHIRASRR
jgi:hypothetical protein